MCGGSQEQNWGVCKAVVTSRSLFLEITSEETEAGEGDLSDVIRQLMALPRSWNLQSFLWSPTPCFSAQ